MFPALSSMCSVLVQGLSLGVAVSGCSALNVPNVYSFFFFALFVPVTVTRLCRSSSWTVNVSGKASSLLSSFVPANQAFLCVVCPATAQDIINCNCFTASLWKDG